MTDFLESVRPVEPTSAEGAALETEPTAPSVRQLLAELARLEDVVRAAGASVDDPEVLAALAREQEIVDELRRPASPPVQPA